MGGRAEGGWGGGLRSGGGEGTAQGEHAVCDGAGVEERRNEGRREGRRVVRVELDAAPARSGESAAEEEGCEAEDGGDSRDGADAGGDGTFLGRGGDCGGEILGGRRGVR